MTVPNFIAKSTAIAEQCLRTGGEAVVEHFVDLRDRIVAQKGRPAASLFAEPVLSQKSGGWEIAWYSDYPGVPTTLNALDSSARTVVVERLKERLATLAPLLSDATIGPRIARAFYIQSADDIFVLGQEPVLVNWAVLPAQTSHTDQAALDRHFAATLGPYAPFSAPRIADVRVTPVAAPALGSPAVPLPPRRFAGFELVGLLIATVIAASLTLLLNLPGVLTYPAAAPAGENNADALEAQRAVTKAMQDKIAAAAAALKASTCNPDGALKIDLPGGKTELPPKQIPLRPQPGDARGDMSRVADVATQSVVLVVAFLKNGSSPPSDSPKRDDSKGAPADKPDAPDPETKSISVGSGFFIGPKTIVTNEHVIDGAETVFITNHFLGKLQRVVVKFQTHNTKLFEPDFAVLESESDNSPPAVTLSATAARLMNVVSAGFPGIVNEWDPQYQKLFDGDVAAAPEVTTFPGFVTLIQEADSALPRIVHSATIGHGNSGGPLLDLCGRALGVNTLKNTRDADIGYVVSNALATKGLLTFLDANHVSYQRADEPCSPNGDSPKPAPVDKTPVGPRVTPDPDIGVTPPAANKK